MHASLLFLTVLLVLAVQCAQSVPNDHSQCQKHGHLGACNVGKVNEVWRDRCRNLRCATKAKIGDEHIGVSIGKAAVGTICGVSRACNSKHKCAPVLNLPQQVGKWANYRCYPENL